MIIRPRIAVVAGLAAAFLLGACGRSERKTDAPAAVPVVRMTPAEAWQALEAGISVTGSAERASVSVGFGWQTSTKQKWTVSLQLANHSKLPLQMGRRLILYETDSAMGMEGVAVLRDWEPGTNVLFQGFDLGIFGVSNFDSWNHEGGRMIREGGTITFTFGAADTNAESANAVFRPLDRGEVRPIFLELTQGVWIRDEHLASVRVVLPYLTARTPEGDVSVVPVAFLQKEGDQAWRVARCKLYRIESDALGQLLAASDADVITRLQAAVWLAESFPERAGAFILPVASTLRQGYLLHTCMQVLAALRVPGAESHADSLLSDAALPNGIRSSAAEYLGAVRHTGSVERLAAAARDVDKGVSAQCVLSLGQIGGPAASSNLMVLARAPGNEDLRKKAIAQLGRVRAPEADAYLKAQVADEKLEALQALVDANRVDLFAYYQGLLATTNTALRNVAIHGLADGPPEQAVAALMALLAEQPVSDAPKSPLPSAVVQTLITMKPTNQVARLTEMARTGHAPAAEVLVALSPVTDDLVVSLAREVQEPHTLAVLLAALDRKYVPAHDRIFLDRLQHADARVVKAAINGLSGHKESSAHLPRLLALAAQDAREDVREAARQAIRTTRPGGQADALVAAVLQPVRRDTAEAAVASLINADDLDPALFGKVARALDGASATNAYPLIVLLRRLGQGSGPPYNTATFDSSPDKWIAQWRGWAATNAPAGKP